MVTTFGPDNEVIGKASWPFAIGKTGWYIGLFAGPTTSLYG
jgi:hypothetical protein